MDITKNKEIVEYLFQETNRIIDKVCSLDDMDEQELINRIEPVLLKVYIKGCRDTMLAVKGIK